MKKTFAVMMLLVMIAGFAVGTVGDRVAEIRPPEPNGIYLG